MTVDLIWNALQTINDDKLTFGTAVNRLKKCQIVYSRLTQKERKKVRIEFCHDEKTGVAYGNAACRIGRAIKLGGGGTRRFYDGTSYQCWMVWS